VNKEQARQIPSWAKPLPEQTPSTGGGQDMAVNTERKEKTEGKSAERPIQKISTHANGSCAIEN
jgi:hypothetical protein